MGQPSHASMCARMGDSFNRPTGPSIPPARYHATTQTLALTPAPTPAPTPPIAPTPTPALTPTPKRPRVEKAENETAAGRDVSFNPHSSFGRQDFVNNYEIVRCYIYLII